MNKPVKDAINVFEKYLPIIFSSPEALFWLVFVGFGGVAAGWFFIGFGALLALAPLAGFAFYGLILRRKMELKRPDL